MNASKTSSGKTVPTDVFEAIVLKDVDAVKTFVETSRVPLKSLKNSEKQTPAHVAAQFGHLDLLKYLLQKDSSVLKLVDHYGNNVLFWAARGGSKEIVEYLVDVHEVDVAERHRLNLGNCAIHIAAEYGRLDVLKYCLETRHGDVNIQNDLGESPIFSAAEKTQLDTIKYLVEERHANVTMTDDNNDNVLYVCAKKGELAVAKYLLDERNVEFDIDHRNNQGCTVTFVAAKYDNLELVKYFVEQQHANISIADENGNTPLHEAADIGYYEVVHYLVEQGADLDVRNTVRNKTAQEMATDKDIKRFLKDSARKRIPRSVPKVLQLRATLGSRMRENCVEIHGPKTLRGTTFGEFMAWLAVANICVNFFTKSRHKRPIDWSVMSPPKLLRRRMDPLAVEAAVDFLRDSNDPDE